MRIAQRSRGVDQWEVFRFMLRGGVCQGKEHRMKIKGLASVPKEAECLKLSGKVREKK